MTTKQHTQTITLMVAAGILLLASFMGMTSFMTSYTQTASATVSGDRGVYFWHSGLCSTGATACNTILTETLNAEKGSVSLLIFHYSGTQTPTALQIDTMQEAIQTGGADEFKCHQMGMQGTSLSQLETLADSVVTNFKNEYSCTQGPWLGYNLESGLSPASEVSDPVGSYEAAKAIAAEHGLRLLAAPANSMLNSNPQAADIAEQATLVVVNVAGVQDADCTEARDEAIDNADRIHSVHPTKVIIYQTSLTRTGATVEMMNTCGDEIIPETGIQGWTIWCGSVHRDNGDCETANAYNENNFPGS